jgi:hypothetical protein
MFRQERRKTMRVFVASVLAGAMLMGASGLMAKTPQVPTTTQYERWFSAKFGRTSPSEEARLQAQAVETQATTQSAVTSNWYEQWFRAKFGRTSPSEEARLRSNPAFNEEVTSRIVGAPVNNYYEQWYQAKFGRSPQK